MIYSRKITGNESEAFRLLIDRIIGIRGLTHFPRIPIGEVRVVTESFDRFAGSGKLVLRKPYLADKDDLIAFDKTTQTIVYNFKYSFEDDGTNTLIIGLRWFSSNWVVYPIAAVLMHAANDIDISDDNFRAWLINNRPKVNKAEKMDIPEENNELFKFLQLRERAGDVKITQEMGQELFKALFDRANAIAHEEVSSDALATDTSEFMLALVNNIINSAPKPATRFDRVELKDFIRMNAMYMKENGRQLLSGEDYYIAGTDEADALRVLGEPCPTVTCCKVWYFSMYGRIICRVYSAGHELVLNVARGTLLSMREQVLDDVIDMLLNSGRLNGKK